MHNKQNLQVYKEYIVLLWANIFQLGSVGFCQGQFLFIDDIDYAVDTIIIKIADGWKLYERLRTEEDALSMKSSLDSILKLAYGWLMFFNLNKCKVLRVGKTI